MNDLDNEMIKGAVGEAILDQLKIIQEYLKDVPTRQEITARFDAIETEIQTIKAVVIDQTGELRNHAVRIAALKAA